jgi:hypothetical protein
VRTEPLELSFTVACRREHAFDVCPRRLVYLWHLRFDRADATEVETAFAPEPSGAGTAVTIVHRGRERLGAKGPERRARNERGWGGLIPNYVATCAATV